MPQKITYCSFMLLSALATLLLYLCDRHYWKQERFRPLTFVYLFNIVSALCNVFWMLSEGNPARVRTNYLCNIGESFCNLLCSYCWFLHTCRHSLLPRLNRKSTARLCRIPLAAVLLLVLLTPLTHWIFLVDAAGVYQRGPFFWIQLLGYLYLAASIVIAAASDRKSEFLSQKKKYLTMIVFALFPLLLGGAQLLLPPAVLPTGQFSIFLALMLVFADRQERRITRDSLTDLANRYELERRMDQIMYRASQLSQPLQLFVLVGDLDEFKSVNDTCGHLEGDRALHLAGNAIAAAAGRHRALAARYSGDEFCVLISTGSVAEVKEFIRECGEELQAVSRGRPYRLSISFGYAPWDGRRSFRAALNEADEQMYYMKRREAR